MRRQTVVITVFSGLIAAALFFFWSAKPEMVKRLLLTGYEFYSRLFPRSGEITTSAEEESSAEKFRQLNLRLAQKDAEIFALERALNEFENFRRTLPNYRSVAAQIIGRSFLNDEVIIDAGAFDEIESGWAAAQGLGLAGIVGMTAENVSFVLLTSNPNCAVPARAEKSREICLVRGSGDEYAIATFYSTQTAATPGEKILTSGLLGKIPAGLVIGTIENFPLRGKEPGTMEMRVKLAANFSALEHLLIVSPLLPTPSVPAR